MLDFLQNRSFFPQIFENSKIICENPHENDSLTWIQNLYSIQCDKRITQ